ncbi:MAG: Crp/Fnr family transcriptional regulator [Rhizobiales bacterium]|nr:Crp/Fnr family transcriptional regulator [Hyphomicrobiales bacterium]
MLTVLKITAARGAMMTASELSAWLGRTLIFDGLDPEDIDRLAAIVRESSLQQGDILFEQGDESDGLYLIVAGLVRVYLTTEDGREVTVSLLEDGEVIGEMSLLDGLPRSAGAAALIETRLIFIPRAPFLELLETNGKLARQIILTLCERLRSANAQFDQAVFHDLRHRLVVLLRQLAMMVGKVDQHVAVVDLDLTQGTLAQMLGASREAVNKQLRALVKEGRIAVEGQRIQVFKGKG